MKHACQQATKIASDGLDRRLSSWELLRLRFHLALCGNCRSYEHSIRLLHQTADLIRRSHCGELKLSSEQRQRLSEVLRIETKQGI